VTLNFFQRFKLVEHHGVFKRAARQNSVWAYKIIDKIDFHGRGTQWASSLSIRKTGNVTWRLPDGNLDLRQKDRAVRGRGGERVKTVLESWPRSKPAFEVGD